MFADLAPRLRERGWHSIIPIIAGHKRPAIAGWNACNKNPPSDIQIARWARLYSDGGVGLAFGPDHVVGIDLDWLEPGLAARGWQITRSILGDTPLVRIGRPPKRLALYGCDPGLVIDGKAFDGFEIFSHSGQCVMFGIHPGTQKPYRWLTDTPATIAPVDLPLAGSEQILSLIAELGQISPRTSTGGHGGARRQAKEGIATKILRGLTDIKDASGEVARLLAAAPRGKRHNTMVAASLALAMRGYSDAAIFAALDPVYCAMMDDLSREKASEEVTYAVRWARRCAGPDDATIATAMAPTFESIAAFWDRRWGRT